MRTQKSNSSVLAILAFGGSKTLALYGLSVKAQITLSKTEDVISEFSKNEMTRIIICDTMKTKRWEEERNQCNIINDAQTKF